MKEGGGRDRKSGKVTDEVVGEEGAKNENRISSFRVRLFVEDKQEFEWSWSGAIIDTFHAKLIALEVFVL